MHSSLSLFIVGYQASILYTNRGELSVIDFNAFAIVSFYNEISSQRPTLPKQGQLSVIDFNAFTIVSIYSRISMDGCMLESYTKQEQLCVANFNAFTIVSIYSRISIDGCMLESYIKQGQLCVANFNAFTMPLFIVGYQGLHARVLYQTGAIICRQFQLQCIHHRLYLIVEYQASVLYPKPWQLIVIDQASVLLYTKGINFIAFTIVSIHSRISRGGCMLSSYTKTGTIICHQN